MPAAALDVPPLLWRTPFGSTQILPGTAGDAYDMIQWWTGYWTPTGGGKSMPTGPGHEVTRAAGDIAQLEGHDTDHLPPESRSRSEGYRSYSSGQSSRWTATPGNASDGLCRRMHHPRWTQTLAHPVA